MSEEQSDEKTRLLEGIAYFEKALEVMPDDRSTLEFLCIAYEQTGQREKYLQTLVALTQVLVTERDLEGATKLLESVENDDEKEVKAISLKIRAMLSPHDDGAAPSAGGPAVKVVRAESAGKSNAVSAELELMKWLLRKGVVDGELHDKVCAQLQEMESAHGNFLISALFILESENPAAAEAAGACLADETRTPPIALELFDSVYLLANRVPAALREVRGVLPFGEVAGELLVALANPMDEALKMDVVSAVGGKCHFFFVPPSSLGVVAEKLKPGGAS